MSDVECNAGSSGWVKLYRDVMDSDVWQDKPFARGQAWVDLIMLANHKDKEFWFNASCLCIQRGQFVTSKRKLAERWGWSPKKVSKFLAELEKVKMVTVKSDHRKTTINVVNYDKYQRGTSEESAKNQRGTSEESAKNQRGTSEESAKNQRGTSEESQKNHRGISEEHKQEDKEYKEGKKERRKEGPAALSSEQTTKADDKWFENIDWDNLENET